jgi:hypothetical protein
MSLPSVLGQGVFDSPSLTLVISTNLFNKFLNTFKVIRYILRHLESYSCIIRWKNVSGGSFSQKREIFFFCKNLFEVAT